MDGKHKDTNDIYDLNEFDIDGKHIDTNNEYDPNGFNIKDIHRDTNGKYDPNDFDIYYTHNDTDYIHDLNGFDINGKHKYTKNEYDPNGFDIKGIHRDTGTFLNKVNDIRKDISKNINWLKDKGEFLKLYDEIIKNGEFSEIVKKKSISSELFKDFLEDILNGNITDNKIEKHKKNQ